MGSTWPSFHQHLESGATINTCVWIYWTNDFHNGDVIRRVCVIYLYHSRQVYLLGLLAMIKCSICSYQYDN